MKVNIQPTISADQSSDYDGHDTHCCS